MCDSLSANCFDFGDNVGCGAVPVTAGAIPADARIVQLAVKYVF